MKWQCNSPLDSIMESRSWRSLAISPQLDTVDGGGECSRWRRCSSKNTTAGASIISNVVGAKIANHVDAVELMVMTRIQMKV